MGKSLGLLILTFFGAVALVSCSDPRLVAEKPLVVQKTTAVYIKDYCPVDGYRFTEIFAYNTSSILKDDYHITDFDRDGLSDEFEKQDDVIARFNIGAGSWDTNGDAYSDFLIYAIGYDKDNQVRLGGCVNATQDTDGDDLPDCAEAILRTDYTRPDTDNDGVPDGVEIRFGTNPLDPMDVFTDYDQDGLTVLQELKANLPIRNTNTKYTNARAYAYDVETFFNGTQDCHNIRISNIPVVDVSNGNLIHILAVENTTIPTQGDITRMSTLKVLVPRAIQDHLRVVVEGGITNQIVDGISIPLVLEDDMEAPL